jgi:sulfatase modifying factor 1
MKNIIFLFFSVLISNSILSQKIESKRMVVVPANSYVPFLITKSSKPIKVNAFLLDETAVTNQEFLEFVKANPEWSKSKVNRLFADKNYLSHWEGDFVIGVKNNNILNSPVVNVSWFAADAYCAWKNKRLPSVAEWEIAGRYEPKHIKFKSLTEYILNWYRRPNDPILGNIKSTFQNKLGLYDMHGLVWEWTFNFNSYITSGDSRQTEEDEQKLFCAAGSINVTDRSDYAAFLRFSYRGSLKGNYCIANLGFRCAKSIK